MSAPSSLRTISLEGRREKFVDFSSISLRLASPEEILSWSNGEVLRPETINYRSQKPERDGLFCQKIFGPVKDWECACGKYKKIRYKGIVCDRCGVEITRSTVRRERMGHITLAAPVTHIWYLRGVPSKIGLLLDLSIQSLEKVVYFANFIITEVNEPLKEQTLLKLKEEFKKKKEAIKKETKDKEEAIKNIEELTASYKETEKEIKGIVLKRFLSELDYRQLSLKYGYLFTAKMGAEAIRDLLSNLDLKKMIKDLEKEKENTKNPTQQKKIAKVIKIASNFLKNKIKPEWMVLEVIPVIPPDLRPLVQLDGGRFASSDLNDLYRRVINRNNRLRKLIEFNAPEVILRNEKRMLQEAVDSLMDNDMRVGKTVAASTGQSRPLKSLADILEGKQGRFRQNLLGKRVDYSGRSVIVVNPNLKLFQCGLPKIMALELFKPFVASQLIKRKIVHNVRSANHMIDEKGDVVFSILEEVVKNSYVLLNRAPTLHRISIQAFQPVLVEGKAIQVHPLICPAYNADFDGDQMAVYLPISEKAIKEAETILLSTHNLLKPATGQAIVTPPKDMVWGAYWMTTIKSAEEEKSRLLKSFSSPKEAIFAYESGKIDLRELIKVEKDGKIIEATVGRLIFSNFLPEDIYNLKEIIDRRKLEEIVRLCFEKYGDEVTVEILDKIKETTLYYLTKSGLSMGLVDLPEIKGKDTLIKEGEKKVQKLENLWEQGFLTEEEKYRETIRIWLDVRDKITELVRQSLSSTNTALSMINSGARGSWSQLTQMIGIKGIVSSPTGRLIELPITSSFKEGFSSLEYFISTHGSRKGVSDTALRTPAAGYLTRRMVDVAQDVIITSLDCQDKEGLCLTKKEGEEMGVNWQNRLLGRVLAKDVYHPKTGEIVAKKDVWINQEISAKIKEADPDEVYIRSALTCKLRRGICSKCYGYDLSTLKPVEIGVPVGVIAAQSIGEPGMQLTLRTFHAGGVAGADIVQGLPRVEELFEARPVKREAILARFPGKVTIKEEDKKKNLILDGEIKKIEEIKIPHNYEVKVKDGNLVLPGDVIAQKGNSIKEKITSKYRGTVVIKDKKVVITYEEKVSQSYDLSGYIPWVKSGDKVEIGQVLTDGSVNLSELYYLQGKIPTQKYILKEIQYVYASHGQALNDKHIEIIIRQMFSRILIEDGGDTDLLPGEIVPRAYFEEVNENLKKNEKPATAREILLGISRVSLSTDSWLAAASFQETSRVLINASINGRPDYLRSLKENVIIGRLIPAGTNFSKGDSPQRSTSANPHQ